MPNMTSYDRGDVVLAILPFSDPSGIKKRPAVVVSAQRPSVDLLLLPLTSQTQNLQPPVSSCRHSRANGNPGLSRFLMTAGTLIANHLQ